MTVKVWCNGETVKKELVRGTLLLGEAPGELGVVPLRGPSPVRHLVAAHGLEGWPDEQGWNVANVFDELQEREADGRGSEFDMAGAIRAVDLDVIVMHDRIVTLGARVFDALQAKCTAAGWAVEFPHRPQWLDVARLDDVEDFLVLRWPHPSGLNRYWNDPMDRERAYEVFRAFVGVVRREI